MQDILNTNSHSYLNEDCLHGMKKIAANSVSLIFCDLPYGVTACSWDKVINPKSLWGCIDKILAHNGVAVFTATYAFGAQLVMTSCIPFKYDLVWAKNRLTGFLSAGKAPMRQHENILVFARPKGVFNPQMQPASVNAKFSTYKPSQKTSSVYRHRRDGTQVFIQDTARQPVSIVKFGSKSTDRQMHPTQKPVGLMEWIVATYTNQGDTVLDPTMGSGTTGVACARLGRRFIGIKKDPTIFGNAVERIEVERRMNGSRGVNAHG